MYLIICITWTENALWFFVVIYFFLVCFFFSKLFKNSNFQYFDFVSSCLSLSLTLWFLGCLSDNRLRIVWKKKEEKNAFVQLLQNLIFCLHHSSVCFFTLKSYEMFIKVAHLLSYRYNHSSLAPHIFWYACVNYFIFFSFFISFHSSLSFLLFWSH